MVFSTFHLFLLFTLFLPPLPLLPPHPRLPLPPLLPPAISTLVLAIHSIHVRRTAGHHTVQRLPFFATPCKSYRVSKSLKSALYPLYIFNCRQSCSYTCTQRENKRRQHWDRQKFSHPFSPAKARIPKKETTCFYELQCLCTSYFTINQR